MKKRLAVLTTMLCMSSLIFSGCGSSSSTTPSASDTSSETSSAEAADSEADSDSSAETAEGAVTLRLGHVVADESSLDKGLDKLAELVAEKSGGSLILEIYPNSQLGDNVSMAEQLQFGSLDMMAPSIAALNGFENSTALFDLPYLFKNESAAEETLDGEIGDALADKLSQVGFECLGYMTQSWRHVTCNKEVHTPADMAGIKIRTMDSAYHIAHFNALGASAIPMSMSEVYTALQQGTIDAQENPYTNIVTSRFYEVQDYVVETAHIYDACPVLVSSITWANLSDEHKAVLEEATAEAVEWERAEVMADDTEMKAMVEESGTTVIELTDEERDAFKEAAQPVYETYYEAFGDEGRANVEAIEAINAKY